MRSSAIQPRDRERVDEQRDRKQRQHEHLQGAKSAPDGRLGDALGDLGGLRLVDLCVVRVYAVVGHNLG